MQTSSQASNFRNNQFRAKLGQNTAEYLILLVLVAVGSIGIFSVFGSTTKRQISAVVAAMTGQRDAYTTAVGESGNMAGAAATSANRASSMGGVAEEEVLVRGEDMPAAGGGTPP